MNGTTALVGAAIVGLAPIFVPAVMRVEQVIWPLLWLLEQTLLGPGVPAPDATGPPSPQSAFARSLTLDRRMLTPLSPCSECGIEETYSDNRSGNSFCDYHGPT